MRATFNANRARCQFLHSDLADGGARCTLTKREWGNEEIFHTDCSRGDDVNMLTLRLNYKFGGPIVANY